MEALAPRRREDVENEQEDEKDRELTGWADIHSPMEDDGRSISPFASDQEEEDDYEPLGAPADYRWREEDDSVSTFDDSTSSLMEDLACMHDIMKKTEQTRQLIRNIELAQEYILQNGHGAPSTTLMAQEEHAHETPDVMAESTYSKEEKKEEAPYVRSGIMPRKGSWASSSRKKSATAARTTSKKSNNDDSHRGGVMLRVSSNANNQSHGKSVEGLLVLKQSQDSYVTPGAANRKKSLGLGDLSSQFHDMSLPRSESKHSLASSSASDNNSESENRFQTQQDVSPTMPQRPGVLGTIPSDDKSISGSLSRAGSGRSLSGSLSRTGSGQSLSGSKRSMSSLQDHQPATSINTQNAEWDSFESPRSSKRSLGGNIAFARYSTQRNTFASFQKNSSQEEATNNFHFNWNNMGDLPFGSPRSIRLQGPPDALFAFGSSIPPTDTSDNRSST